MAARKIDGWWYADFYVRGERYRERSPVNTRASAQIHEQELRGEIALHDSLDHLDPKKQLPEKGVPTFSTYADEWIVTYVRNNNRHSEQLTKASIIERHLRPFFGEKKLDAISRIDIEYYKSAKLTAGLVPKTINNHLMILSKCLRTAREDEVIEVVPHIRWLKLDPPAFDFLTPLESHQLLQDTAEPLWSELARLAVRTGMRRGELMALDWSAVDLRNARLTVCRSLVEGVIQTPKGYKIRHLPLTTDVVEMLSRRERRQGFVFTRADGSPLGKSVMTGGILRICRRTGLRPIGWHVLRHTYASQLAMEGVPLLIISRLMGHSTIKMTERYAHLAPSPLAEAVPLLLRAEARAIASFGQPVGSEARIASNTPLLLPSF